MAESKHSPPSTRPTPSGRRLIVEAELTLQRFENDTDRGVQSVKVSTQSDGTVMVSSEGTLQRTSLRQIAQAREAVRRFAEATGQDVVMNHNGREVARLRTESARNPKWSIRWLTVIRYFFRSG